MSLHRVIEDDNLRILDGENEVMVMQETVDGNTASIKLTGMLRSDIVLDVQDELCAFATLGMDLILDLSDVTYLSTACQRALVTVQQKLDRAKKGSLLLRNTPKRIYAELEETGMTALLQIDEG